MIGTAIQERAWLRDLAKWRIVVITFLLGIELAITRLTPIVISERLFVSVIVLGYAVAAFYLLLLQLWEDTYLQARLHIATDLIFTTAIVYVSGGVDSPFNFLFLLVILMASMLLARAATYIVAGMAFILFGTVVELSYFEIIPSYSMNRPDPKSFQFAIFMTLAASLAMAYLASQLSEKLRRADVELKEKGGALENLQALYGNIINSMSGGLITTGLDGRISVVNPQAEALLEMPALELYGKPVTQFFLDRLPEIESGPARGEVRAVTPKNNLKTFALTASELIIPDRGVVGHVFTLDDLSEIKRLEREVRMRDRLSAVGRMAAGIAHEIRNPLASIAGSVKVLAGISNLTDEQRDLVDIMTRESERLNAIITDFLNYSREKNYKFAVADLRPLLEDTLTLLENRPHPGKLTIVRDFHSEQAPAVIDGDRMKQVFWNICENAVRAMPNGGTLTVGLRPLEETWLLSFADTGMGLSPEEIEKIFEPFQSQFQGGTGLGLAIVYQILQAHDARIHVRSARGQGAEFILEVKRAQAAPLAEAVGAGRTRG
jgi:two-component system, NtrC family, sensor histidine kinase PilS